MAEKHADWPTKFDVAKTLGLSVRSIERLINEKQIRAVHRRVPGRKALTICHPQDVAKIKATILPPVPVPSRGAVPAPRVPAKIPLPELVQALSPTPRVPLDKKLYLTVKEVSAYSGLPQSYLRRLLAGGELKALSAGGYRIRRADLEAL